MHRRCMEMKTFSLVLAFMCLLLVGMPARSQTWFTTCSTGVTPLCVDGASLMAVYPRSQQSQTFTYGALSLGLPQIVTASVSGVQVGDSITCVPATAPTSGLVIYGCWVSASGTVTA